MAFADRYLSRHTNNQCLIDKNPAKDVKIIVIIPSYNESGLINSLDSLFKAEISDFSIEVIVNINWPEDADEGIIERSERLFTEASDWSERHSSNKRQFFILKSPLQRKKHAGVGLARKIAMDEATRRFNILDKEDGLICSFDADSECDPNYFQKIAEHFNKNPKTDACSIYFEHPITGTEFPPEAYQGITLYELHLRYYVRALRFTGHPNIFQTIGSAFAVKTSIYCKEGGMNKKKAGEDFYFLQKIFDLGNYSDCNTTRVIPSSRPSDRVPFGTGRAISDYLKSGEELKTYNPELFLELKIFIQTIKQTDFEDTNFRQHFLDAIPPTIMDYLKSINFEIILDEIINNSSNPQSFVKRFFRWFNMFRIMKFLNYAEKYYPEIEVKKASGALLKLESHEIQEANARTLLIHYRELEK